MVDFKKALRELQEKRTKAPLAPSSRAEEKKWREQEEEEPIPAIEDLPFLPGDRLRVKLLVNQIAEQNAIISDATKAKTPLVERLKELMKGEFGEEKMKMLVDDVRVSYYSTSRKSIKSELLLTQGVLPSVIQKATVTTKSMSVRITPPGNELDEHGEDA